MAAITKYTQGSPTAFDGNKTVLDGLEKIIFTPYVAGEPGNKSYLLESIVADSVSITQDDPSTNNIDCETSDTPIKTTTVQGGYTIEMVNADFRKDLLQKVLGYEAPSNITPMGSSSGATAMNIAIAPESTPTLYCCIELVFHEDAILVCPKVNLASKIDISSVKTETCKVTISGSLEAYNIGTPQSPINTPFFVIYPNA